MRRLWVGLLFAVTLTSRAADAPAPTIPTVSLPWPPPLEQVEWVDAAAAPGKRLSLKLLGFNDFHGSLLPGRPRGGRPAGGAAALAAYFTDASRTARGRTLIVHAGDHLGASPPLTRLLQNEPAIAFLNLLGNRHCRLGNAMRFYDAKSWRRKPNRCNVIGTTGNHEFDAGLAELHRLLNGGNSSLGPFLDHPWRGSRVPYVAANVLERATGRTALPPYAVVALAGFPVGVIGATTTETSKLIPAQAAEQLEFLDEAEAVNRSVAELKANGIHTLIVTIHKGMEPTMSADGPGWKGPIREFVAQLDEDVDVVIAGHTHSFTNALFPNRGGKSVLVTQAYEYGIAYANIDLQVNVRTRDVVAKSARIEPTWIDAGPGLRPDARATELTRAAEALVATTVNRVIARTATPITRQLTPGGESALGNLAADALRALTGADIAFINAAALRADLAAGEVKVSDAMTVLPFDNHIVTYELTGAELLELLESQWHIGPQDRLRLLKTSGFSYVWDGTRPVDHRVVGVCDGTGGPLDRNRRYRIATNDYLANGGDHFTYLTKHKSLGSTHQVDSDALIGFLETYREPLRPNVEGRIVRLDAASSSATPAVPALCQVSVPID